MSHIRPAFTYSFPKSIFGGGVKARVKIVYSETRVIARQLFLCERGKWVPKPALEYAAHSNKFIRNAARLAIDGDSSASLRIVMKSETEVLVSNSTRSSNVENRVLRFTVSPRVMEQLKWQWKYAHDPSFARLFGASILGLVSGMDNVRQLIMDYAAPDRAKPLK